MYKEFAKVYDLFMEDIPYDDWCQYITSLLRENGIEGKAVVELGCGTGQLTRRLVTEGYRMTGVDISEDMIKVAKEEGGNIDYIVEDMTELVLETPTDAIISVCDSINYLTQEGDLACAIMCAYENLKPAGVFIFDMKTEHFYKNILGNSTIAENREDASFIWENTYYEDERINEYNLTLFIKEKDSDSYKKYNEMHYQKAFLVKEVLNELKKVDFFQIEVYNAFTREKPKEDSERIYFVCKK